MSSATGLSIGSHLARRLPVDSSPIKHISEIRIIAIMYALVIIAWLIIGLRSWTRIRFNKILSWDDGFMVLTAVYILTSTGHPYHHAYLFDLGRLVSQFIAPDL
jgi:hypothetical protein